MRPTLTLVRTLTRCAHEELRELANSFKGCARTREALEERGWLEELCDLRTDKHAATANEGERG